MGSVQVTRVYQSLKEIRVQSKAAFESSFELICRAREHLNSLEAELNVVFNENNITWLSLKDAETGYITMRVKFSGKISKKCSTIVNDAVFNARAALDHAVQASYDCLVSPPKSNPSLKFAFGDNKVQLHNNMSQKCKDVPEPIRNLMEKMAPYKDGNRTLWALNKLRNRKTHKVLTPLGIVPSEFAAYRGRNLVDLNKEEWDVIPKNAWNPATGELTVCVVPDGYPDVIGGHCRFTAAIYGIPEVGSQSAPDTIREFIREAERAVEKIKKECFIVMNSTIPSLYSYPLLSFIINA